MLFRNVIAIILLLALAGVEARAQIPRVGILLPEMGRAESQATRGFKEELTRLGFQDRKNILFEIRNAKRDRSAFQAAADDLVRQKVEVILTSGASATRSAAAASLDIPIVFIYAGDPALAGFGQGSNATNMNITGVAALARDKMETRLAHLKEIIPTLQTLHIFFDWNNRYSRDNFARAESSAKNINLQALGHPIKSIEELNATIGNLDSEQGDAIFQISDDLIESAAERIFNLARKKKIPTMFNEEVWAIKGAMAAYGPNYRQMGRQAGQMASSILKGRKPDSIPIEQASKFDLTLNYRTASFIGVRLTQTILDKADKVIR